MKPFSLIRQTKTYLEIVEQIADLVRSENLRAGEKLPSERALAKELGTGRQCLREALSVLEAVGVLEVKHGLGTYVKEGAMANLAKLSAEEREALNPFEAIEVRRVLESAAVALAAKRARTEDIALMEKMLAQLEAILADNSYSMGDNRDLHIVFIESAHNAVLSATAADLINRTERMIWLAVKEKSLEVPGRATQYLHDHRQIIEAIKQGDARKAALSMRHHWTHIEQDLRYIHGKQLSLDD
jgi:GntR family transcriptional repressor for pyruvate dehydrogenase complex